MKKMPLVCGGHSRPVVDLAYSSVLSDGSFYLVSGCLDGKPMLRDGSTGDWIGTFNGHKGAVWSARMNDDATQVVTASADCTVRVWSAIVGTELACFPHKKIVRSASLSDQGLVLSGGNEPGVRIFDQSRAEPLAVVGDQHLPTVKFVHWGRPDCSLIVACNSESIQFWDPKRSAAAGPVKTLQMGVVSRIETTPDRKSLVCTAGSQVALLSLDSLDVYTTVTCNAPLLSAGIDPTNSKYCVVGGSDHSVRLLDVVSGEELECNRGHHGPVHSVCFAPDGKTFASGSEDGTIRLWLKKNKPYRLWTLGEPIVHSMSDNYLTGTSAPLTFDPPTLGAASIMSDSRRRNRTKSALSALSRC